MIFHSVANNKELLGLTFTYLYFYSLYNINLKVYKKLKLQLTYFACIKAKTIEYNFKKR